MYKLNTYFQNFIHSKKGYLVIMVLTIALFVLSAGAPNAMGGIGK